MRRASGLLAGAASGGLVALAFPPAGLSWLAWVALVPLLLPLREREGKGGTFPAFLAFGAVSFSAGLSWLVPVIGWPGVVLLALLLWALFVLPAGACLALALRRGIPLVLAAPVVWVAFDWLRSWLFSGFPWLYLAHSQAWNLPLVQCADVFGAWGVTAMLVLGNSCVVEAVRAVRAGGGPRAAVRLAPAAAVVAAALVYGAVRPGTLEIRDGPAVLLVQANIPQYEKHEVHHESAAEVSARILRRHLALTAEGVRAHPESEVVVWPETMFPWRITRVPGERMDLYRRHVGARLREVARAAGGRPVILGALSRTAEGESRNSAFLVTPAGAVGGRYDKLRPVPGGEYIPLTGVAPKALTDAIGRWIERSVGYFPDLTAGEAPVVFEVAGAGFAPLVCYEICYPSLVRDTLDRGADVFLNITNYGWYPDTDQPEQADQISLLRAIECRRPVVVSANTGISSIIDPRGRVSRLEVDGVSKEVAGLLAGRVPLSRSGSPYALWGDLLAWIFAGAALLLVGEGILGAWRARRRRDRP